MTWLKRKRSQWTFSKKIDLITMDAAFFQAAVPSVSIEARMPDRTRRQTPIFSSLRTLRGRRGRSLPAIMIVR